MDVEGYTLAKSIHDPLLPWHVDNVVMTLIRLDRCSGQRRPR